MESGKSKDGYTDSAWESGKSADGYTDSYNDIKYCKRGSRGTVNFSAGVLFTAVNIVVLC